MVEPRRKHGSFDPRYPTLSTPATPTWVLRADAGLDWTEFLTRFFPGRRRHDIEALAAYGAYRNGLEQRAIDDRDAYRPSRPMRAVPTGLGHARAVVAGGVSSGGTRAMSHPDTNKRRELQRFSAEPGGTLASPFIDRTRA